MSARLFLFASSVLAKALGPGERWITVHPHGRDEKGQPVLVQPQKDGSYKVIGGAGGKLNHMRLTGVKSQGEYAETLRGRAEERRKRAARQRQRDKELGLYEAKAEAHRKISEARRDHQAKFVAGVGEAMGWDAADYQFDEAAHADKPDHVVARLRAAHTAEMVKRAQAVVKLNRERLLADASTRAEVETGVVGLSSEDPDKLGVQDIDPVRPASTGLGFATNYKGRAEEAGADEAEVKAEAEEFKRELTPEQRAAAIANGETAQMVAESMELLRDGDSMDKLSPKLVEAKKALDLMKLEKKLKMAERQAREARAKINESTEEPKAFLVEIDSAAVDDAVASEVAADLRTISTRAFLEEVGKVTDAPLETLGRHVGAGAYNSVNALALAAGGAALVDRSVVDVLGIAGAAEVLSRRLHNDLTPDEVKDVADGIEDFHLNHYMAASEEAIGQARELQAAAKEFELGAAEHGHDLAALREINQRRADALAESKKVLGRALGEMEANAALVYAMRRGKSDKPFQVSLGSTSTESAIQQVRAIGLQRGDYVLERVAGNQVLTIQPEGLDRLARPVNRADLEQVRRNLDIIEGKHDEDDWLPEGFADRPDLGLDLKAGVAPTLAEPFTPGDDLEASIRDYIGGRAADGDLPADIVADLQSAEFFGKVGAGRSAEYRAALDRVAPLVDADGKLRQADALRPAFEKMADSFVERRYGGPTYRVSLSETGEAFDAGSMDEAFDWLAERTGLSHDDLEGDWQDDDLYTGGADEHEFAIEPAGGKPTRSALHRQEFPVDDVAVDALHRALAAEPTGVAAYKPIGELTPQDQGALRDYFAKHVARETPEAAALRNELEVHTASEPERHVEDMFGETTTNPEWSEWRTRRDEMRAQVSAGSMTWSKYVEAMRGPERAYAAVQDLVRSNVSKGFADAYNRLNPAAPLKVGRAVIRENLTHLDAVDPKAAAARAAKERALTDSLRNRVQGRYAAGGVREKLEAAREEQAGFEAAQMGFFADEAPAERALGADERHTIGHAAERQVAAMMGEVGRNFKPGQPVKLFRPTMSGGKNAPRQRAIKLVDANKRAILSFGTGSGKTAIGLGAFTHLHSQGKAKRGLFLAPSIAQENFGAEALRFLKPGAYRWHAKGGASREERIAAYKDPAHHFTVMTHQAFRDDMLHLGAQHAGVDESEMSARLADMSRGERKEWLRGVMRREGISYDYLNVDEGHDLLNRKGKANSALANVVDSLGDTVPYYVNASADPIKNDVSEAFSLLQKMDPERYTDQAEFMRRYGPDTLAAKEGLRRELARFQFPSKIDPDITATRSEHKVPLSEGQKRALDELDGHLADARMSRLGGEVNVAAMKAISPSSFEGEGDHEAIARELQGNLGILKETAIKRILDTHPESGKINDVAEKAKARAGKQGVVFAHSLEAVEAIRQRLADEGHRVATITGKDSAKEKAAKIRQFRPAKGAANVDILVSSDAGATGANLQSGRWLINYDTPETAKTHAQRNGRINRIGQEHDVELMDLVADHPAEQRRRDRLATKYGLREALTTPMESLDDTGVALFIRQRQIARENGGEVAGPRLAA